MQLHLGFVHLLNLGSCTTQKRPYRLSIHSVEASAPPPCKRSCLTMVRILSVLKNDLIGKLLHYLLRVVIVPVVVLPYNQGKAKCYQKKRPIFFEIQVFDKIKLWVVVDNPDVEPQHTEHHPNHHHPTAVITKILHTT